MGIVGRALLGVFLGIMLIVGIVYYAGHQLEKNDCLVNKAKQYCEKKALDYIGLYNVFYEKGFLCTEDLRQHNIKQEYSFLPEELEECKQ